MITVPHEFPIPTARPGESELTWFRETAMAPGPVPMLDFAYLELVCEGFGRAAPRCACPCARA